MKFVIFFIESQFDEGGYYTGKTYMYQGATYAICQDRVTDEIKKYTSRTRAENSAKSLVERTANVYRWEIREI